MTQMPLIAGMPEIEVGTKEDGMHRSEMNANPVWGEFAYRCVAEVAARRTSFTSDDVDDHIQSYPIPNRPVTHDKRALGPVMNRAARAGVITPTDRILASTRKKLHGSPRRIWNSLIAGSVQEDSCAA